jgi:hypothetical protein
VKQNKRTMLRALSLKHIKKGGRLLKMARAQSTLSNMLARIGTGVDQNAGSSMEV